MRTQLTPSYNLTILRQLSDPTDTGTYYVRAYVRKTADNSLIGTFNLTDRGTQRFTYSWVVPAYTDETEIDIETRVFTDSGYTSESPNYQVESFLYCIKNDSNKMGGFSVGLSANDVRYILKDELKAIKIPEFKETDLSAIISRLDSISRQIDAKPVTDKTDLTPIQTALNGIRNDLSRKIDNIPQPDLEPIIEALGSQNEAINEASNLLKGEKSKMEELLKKVSEIMEKMRGFFFNDMDDLNNKIGELSTKFSKELSKILVITTKPNKNEDDEENS